MSQALKTELLDAPNMLSGRVIVARIRKLILTAGFTLMVYSIFTTANRGYCPVDVATDGSLVGSDGNFTEVVPSCVNLMLQPSGLIYLAIFAIIVVTLNFVLRRANDEESALQYLDRAELGIMILAVASLLISQIWFWMIPITDWNGSGTFYFPFPFGAVGLITTPITTQ